MTALCGPYPLHPDTYRAASVAPIRVSSLDDFLNEADDLGPLSEACASGMCGDCEVADCHCVCHDDELSDTPEDIRAWDAEQDRKVFSDIAYDRHMGDHGYGSPDE